MLIVLVPSVFVYLRSLYRVLKRCLFVRRDCGRREIKVLFFSSVAQIYLAFNVLTRVRDWLFSLTHAYACTRFTFCICTLNWKIRGFFFLPTAKLKLTKNFMRFNPRRSLQSFSNCSVLSVHVLLFFLKGT